MSKRESSQRSQKHPMLLVRLHQDAQLQRRYVAQLPLWRHPLVGYILSIPLIALGLLIPWAEQSLAGQVYFLGAPLYLVTVIVALFWGAGPAIWSILLGIAALDYFFIAPFNQINFNDWKNLLQLVPYFLAELVVALITAQRESARRRALFAEQEIHMHADELEQVNQQLRQNNHLKELFFSQASHELKTPLTTIRGQAQIGLRRLKKHGAAIPELEVVQQSLEKIDGQTHRMHMLVDDLLDMGMLSAGKIKLRMRRCDLSAVCREVAEEQHQLSGRDIELALPQKALLLRGDCERLTQVMTNLVTNAIKYSMDDSTIQIQLSQQAARACIQIVNQGPAIPQDQLTTIFEPFYRATNANTSTKQGWGLGLAICKDIVERHEGRIWATSAADTTTFFVELPLR